MKIGEITASQLNEMVEIQGSIVSVWDLTKGRKCTVEDESGRIPLILWDNVLSGIAQPEQIRMGANVFVRGRVSEYKGELRIVPTEAADVRILSPADDAARAYTPLADVPALGAGRSTWVQGTITEMEAFSKGVKLHIADGSGKAVVLLWQNLYDALPAHVQDDLNIHARVGVFGEISRYRDDWEIVPRSKTEVVILEKAG